MQKQLSIIITFLFIGIVFPAFGQIDNFFENEKKEVDSNKVSFIFLGDIMQHDLQIESAYNYKTNNYDFSSQFKYVKPIFDTTDVVIGNLEVTLAGKPYKGYPRFSSPDELAYDIKHAGINYLLTANNHVYDRGKTGFEKTMKLLDSIELKRTGTFLNEIDKQKNHPLIIEKNDLKIALFNYTYALNGNIVEQPNIVNSLDSEKIKHDLIEASAKDYDAVIVALHWGIEYQHQPNNEQIKLAEMCFENGADIIIGSHPHVVQRMEQKQFTAKNTETKETLIAYSLGNFVSNYGTKRYCDGGTMIIFSLSKSKDGKLNITESNYIPVWVYRKPKENNLFDYYVLPINDFENDSLLNDSDKNQMNIFINDTRKLFNTENINVPEFIKN